MVVIMKNLFLLLFMTLLVSPACAQPDNGGNAGALPDEAYTETERQVEALLAEDGVFVVHFWAPWCHNSRHELRSRFWPELVAEQEEVNFIFVTVYNDGEIDDALLDRFDIPERVVRFGQPDFGESRIKANRRRTFLGLPLTWTPTTWIFHRNGKLAYAVNYGEVSLEMMRTLLDATKKDWG